MCIFCYFNQNHYCAYYSDTESSSSDYEEQTESQSFLLLNLPDEGGRENNGLVFQKLPTAISSKKSTDMHSNQKQISENDEKETENLTRSERRKMFNDSLRTSHFLKG